MSTGAIVLITIAVLAIAITLLVLGLSARRRRQSGSTIGLPDLGAVAGDDPHEHHHAEAGGASLRKSEQRHWATGSTVAVKARLHVGEIVVGPY